MAIIRLTAPAEDALAEIIAHRRREVGFIAARALRQQIMRRVYHLRDFPEMGRRMTTSPNDDRREVIVSPYRIVYRIVGETVSILTIFDGRALPPIENDSDDPRPA